VPRAFPWVYFSSVAKKGRRQSHTKFITCYQVAFHSNGIEQFKWTSQGQIDQVVVEFQRKLDKTNNYFLLLLASRNTSCYFKKNYFVHCPTKPIQMSGKFLSRYKEICPSKQNNYLGLQVTPKCKQNSGLRTFHSGGIRLGNSIDPKLKTAKLTSTRVFKIIHYRPDPEKLQPLALRQASNLRSCDCDAAL
jgi:hypothetical protein